MAEQKPDAMSDWPADSIERWPVDRLVPYARNARTHSDDQVAQVAASIREWGWTVPVLVDEDGTIIAGHGRIMAANKLCIQEVPVMVARGWSEAKKRAYILADNKLAENSGWDENLLKLEVSELGELGSDLSLIGFDDDELTDILAEPGTDGLTDPNDIPEPPAAPVAVSGDIWQLGKHRIACGDSTDAACVEALLGGYIRT